MKSGVFAMAGAMLMMLVLAVSLYACVPDFGVATAAYLFTLSSVLMVVFSIGGKKSFFIIVLAAVAFGYVNILTSGVVIITSLIAALVLAICRSIIGVVERFQGAREVNLDISSANLNVSNRYDHEPIEAYSAGGLPIDYNDGSRIEINPARSIDDLM